MATQKDVCRSCGQRPIVIAHRKGPDGLPYCRKCMTAYFGKVRR